MANVFDTNINLLVGLDALLRDRSVTRAAARMGITQSSMSGVLTRLRELYNDPLLVRVGRGMEPTPLALAIAPVIRRGIEAFDVALAGPPDFDASVSRECFVLAMSDFAEFVMLPRLLKRLSHEAPQIGVQVLPWGRHEPPPQLGTGEFDVMIGFCDSNLLSSDYRESVLFETFFTCIIRPDHPSLGHEFTLDRFCELQHIVITETPYANGVLDGVLSQLGRSRHIAARVPHFLLVPIIIAHTDFIATVDYPIARYFEEIGVIRTLDPPLQLPRGTISMIWHNRTSSDPARSWLRQILEEIGGSIDAAPADSSALANDGPAKPVRSLDTTNDEIAT